MKKATVKNLWVPRVKDSDLAEDSRFPAEINLGLMSVVDSKVLDSADHMNLLEERLAQLLKEADRVDRVDLYQHLEDEGARLAFGIPTSPDAVEELTWLPRDKVLELGPFGIPEVHAAYNKPPEDDPERLVKAAEQYNQIDLGALLETVLEN